MHTSVLILGIGNLLLGDEGVGVHVIRFLQQQELPRGVECLDGGTGSFHLLGPMLQTRHLILVDAAIEDRPPGEIRRLAPRFSTDYPRSLTAHDIGLKDLLDTFHLLECTPRVTLFTVSIRGTGELSTELSPELARRIPELARMAIEEALTDESLVRKTP